MPEIIEPVHRCLEEAIERIIAGFPGHANGSAISVAFSEPWEAPETGIKREENTMRNLGILTAVAAAATIAFATHGANAAFNEEIIWDPNGNFGAFTDPTANFTTILTQLGATATTFVNGGGPALVSAVAAASNGDVIEITDSATCDGGIVITDMTDIVIRAAAGVSPVIDCGVLALGGTCLNLVASADGSVGNIGIKGLTFIDIRFSTGGSAATGHGIASFSGKILENIVIEDNVFDNTDPSKDQSYKGSAIHLNQVDGLLVRRNTILNSSLHSSTGEQEDGAITVHEFLRQPNYLDNVFIQNNEILFDYAGISGAVPTADTRGIVLAHTGKTTTRFNNVVIEYNLIDNVQKEGIKIFGTSTDGTDDETTYVSNIVIKRTANGIEIDGGTVVIDSMIFDGDVTFGSEGKDEAINHDGGSVTVTNTIVTEKLKGVTGTPTLTCIDLFNASLTHPTSTATGTIVNVDPMFVGPGIDDYTIGNAFFPVGCAGGSFGLVFASAAPIFACVGFEPPMDKLVGVRRKNRVLPLKMVLVDDTGAEQTDLDISAPPVVEVGIDVGDTTDPAGADFLSAGRGGDDNEFTFKSKK